MTTTSKRLCLLLLTATIAVVAPLIVLLRVIWELLKSPLTAFKKVPREVPPACLLDPSLGSHEYINVNGMKIHCVISGHRSKPLMLFLHGFPEFWFSWRNQIREFNKDYRVVAIDMRGYGDSSRPPNKLDYTVDKLSKDIAELIPALGYSKCTLVAHDWGGEVGWHMATYHSELIEKFIVMNCPHTKVLVNVLKNDLKQLCASWYLFMLRWPKLPELYFSMGDFVVFERSLLKEPKGIKNKSVISPEVLEAYKYSYSQPGGLSGAINYYRCIMEQPKRDPKQNIQLPVLVIWGDADSILKSSLADEHSIVASNITVRHIPNCSHWVQQDAPEKVNEYMREFLQE